LTGRRNSGSPEPVERLLEWHKLVECRPCLVWRLRELVVCWLDLAECLLDLAECLLGHQYIWESLWPFIQVTVLDSFRRFGLVCPLRHSIRLTFLNPGTRTAPCLHGSSWHCIGLRKIRMRARKDIAAPARANVARLPRRSGKLSFLWSVKCPLFRLSDANQVRRGLRWWRRSWGGITDNRSLDFAFLCVLGDLLYERIPEILGFLLCCSSLAVIFARYLCGPVCGWDRAYAWL